MGLDCSGFVQLVLRLHGVELFRDAHQQAEQGVPSPEPDSGDLVFFGGEEQPERITHVGMMLDRRRFIHARGSDCVRIDALADEPYGRRFRCARRYLALPAVSERPAGERAEPRRGEAPLAGNSPSAEQ